MNPKLLYSHHICYIIQTSMGEKYLTFPQTQTQIKSSFYNATLMDGWHNLTNFSNPFYFTYMSGKKLKKIEKVPLCLRYHAYLTTHLENWIYVNTFV